MVRRKAIKWLSCLCGVCALSYAQGCLLSFDDYPEADLCAAASDAGIQPSTAPDPALRACDAGKGADNQELAGAAGMDGGG